MSNELDNKRLKRLKAIDEILSSTKNGVSMAELIEHVKSSEGVEADRFSIKRDIGLLNEMDFTTISEYRSVRNIRNQQNRKIEFFRYVNPTTTLFKINISQDERDFLSEALAMLGLKGIESMKFYRSLDLKKTNKNKQVISFTKNPVESKVSNRFKDIYDAIRFKEIIRIGVSDRRPPYKTVYHTVHPWYLHEYNRRWYLFGFDEKEQDIRRYTLDRISKFQKLDKTNTKYRAAYKKMNEILHDVVGVSIDDGDILDILFWVSDVSADYVAKKYIHHSQKEMTPEEAEKIVGHPLAYDGGKYFTIRCKENYELRREMLSFGSALVVLSPDILRSTLKSQLKEMLEIYS